MTKDFKEIFEEDRRKLNKRKVNRRNFIKGTAKGVVQLGVIGAGVYGAMKYDEGISGEMNNLESEIKGNKAFTHPKDGEYDMDTRMINDWMQLPNISNSTYHIVVDSTYTDFDALDKDGVPRKIERKHTGTGLLLPYGKIVTAGHVLQVDKTLKRSIFSIDKGKLTEVNYNIMINGEKYKFDKIVDEIGEQDIGIGIAGKLPETVYWNGAMGDFKDLKRGNILYEVGHGLSAGEQLRQGIYGGHVEGEFAHEGLLHFTAGTNPGDSGGPIFAVRDGLFEYVGITVAGISFGQYIADDMTLFEGLEAKTIK